MRELEKEYKEVFIVSERAGGFVVFRSYGIETEESIENECIKTVMGSGKELLVEKHKHFKECIYEKYHKELETLFFRLISVRRRLGI